MDTDRLYAKINLDSFWHNIMEIRKNINSDTMMMGVIKANGYGHGAAALADVLIEAGADWLGVASIDEGIELRNHGVKLPILVLGFTPKAQYKELITYNITPTVYSYHMAEEMNEAAKAMNTCLNIHIKVDTGMRRLGFQNNQDLIITIGQISELDNIYIQGLFTHFACADSQDKSSAYKQLEDFNRIISQLNEAGINIPIKHCSNSAGIIQIPEANFDMVRPGIIMYGLYPSEEVDKERLRLKPVLELKSRVTYVKEVEEGAQFSYGHTFRAARPMRVATISAGYGDGYPRRCSNCGRVLINGQSAPIIGRICMDQMIVDITDLKEISEGDEVTLVGMDGSEQISVEEIAGLAGSFNYEFVCNMNRRIPRIYYRNSQQVHSVSYLFQTV